MRKLFLAVSMLLISAAAGAQGLLGRYSEPGVEKVPFITKGNKAVGISGGYRSYSIGGENAEMGDGFAFLTILNIGDGHFDSYSVSPSFSYFVADDLALDFRLEYSGYSLESDLKLDLRSLEFLDDLFGGSANYKIASRYMRKDSWGLSMALKKYQSFFGSKTFAVFGEMRMFGELYNIVSCPIQDVMVIETVETEDGEKEIEIPTGETRHATEKERNNKGYEVGVRLAGGLAVKLRDNSALTVSFPLVGVTYSYSKQHKNDTDNNAHFSKFNLSRDIDFLAIQVGYVRYF